MKQDKKRAVFGTLTKLVDVAIDLGMAKQRHITAAEEESQIADYLAHLGAEVTELLSKSPPTGPTTIN